MLRGAGRALRQASCWVLERMREVARDSLADEGLLCGLVYRYWLTSLRVRIDILEVKAEGE